MHALRAGSAAFASGLHRGAAPGARRRLTVAPAGRAMTHLPWFALARAVLMGRLRSPPRAGIHIPATGGYDTRAAWDEAMNKTTMTQVSTVALLALAACSDPPPPQTPATPPAAEPAEPAADIPEKNPEQGDLVISDRIRQLCGIDDASAYFPYNSSKLTDSTRALLQKLADCFSTGPLSGEKMHLVGHADPRGDEEYNLALGHRRADAVKRLFVDFKLAADRIETTSRGEADATGSDEESWARDRKVEVKDGA